MIGNTYLLNTIGTVDLANFMYFYNNNSIIFRDYRFKISYLIILHFLDIFVPNNILFTKNEFEHSYQ